MYPVFFRVYGFEVEAFWVTVLLGFLAALGVARSELRRMGHDPVLAYDLIIAAYLGGFVGARLFLVFSEWEAFVSNPLGLLLSGSGWVWQGGVVGGTVAVIAAARRARLPVADVAELAGPCLALGQAIGRLGCQLSGDGDYGVPSDVPWAMAYPDGVVPTDERVHPTPIYEMVLYLTLLAVLWRRRLSPHPRGIGFGHYLVWSGAARFAVEFVRRNPVVAWGLTLPQWVSLVWLASGVALVLLLHRAAARSAP